MTHHEHHEYRAENRMKTARRNVVSAVFHDAENAEDAYARAIERGYSREDVMVLMSDQARDEYFPSERVEVERESKAMEGAGVGGALGTALGAIAGAIAAIGTAVAIPGLGLIVAGPLAGALAGAGAGGAAGGLIGALVGAGIPEYEAKHYEKRLKEGAIVVGAEARTEEEADLLEKDLEALGAEDVKQH